MERGSCVASDRGCHRHDSASTVGGHVGCRSEVSERREIVPTSMARLHQCDICGQCETMSSNICILYFTVIFKVSGTNQHFAIMLPASVQLKL